MFLSLCKHLDISIGSHLLDIFVKYDGMLFEKFWYMLESNIKRIEVRISLFAAMLEIDIGKTF